MQITDDIFDDAPALEPIEDDEVIAHKNWQRYEYGVERGHREFTYNAKRLEGFYLGGGEQWSAQDLAKLAEENRPAYEMNQIKQAIDQAIGYQISNRLDIAFRPASGEATRELADVRSKVAMQIARNCALHWKETEVFSDGIIQQRGFYDVRMSFEDSIFGELSISVLDPMDVIPDPDAKSYDPGGWSDVIVTRWMLLDEIEGAYGKEAAKKVLDRSSSAEGEDDFGSNDGLTSDRNSFASRPRWSYSMDSRLGADRYRVVDRQYWVRELADVAVYPEGDMRVISGDEAQEVLQHIADHKAFMVRKRVKRVRWTVSTEHVLLHDDWSPYDRFTVIPYFPFFRRGKSRGLVDNAVGPQEVMNKAVSQYIHVTNTTANSGWQLEEGQLTNMATEDLEAFGGSTGLVLERKQGTPPLVKIQPNTVPTGVDRLIDRASGIIKSVTLPESLSGASGGIESGVAIQSRQYAAQQVLAVPLDNLGRTRTMLAKWMDYAISKYYNAQRVIRITGSDPKHDESLVVNALDEASGGYLNDLTAGEFDVVISEQPLQITFENSQFQQVLAMIEKGIPIPPDRVVRYSNLADRNEIADEIARRMTAPEPQPDPMKDAKVADVMAATDLKRANAELVRASVVNKSVEGMYSATQAAKSVAILPEVSPLADQFLRSAGFIDKDAAPIIPAVAPLPAELVEQVEAEPQNTNPLTPANPTTGMNEGVEGG